MIHAFSNHLYYTRSCTTTGSTIKVIEQLRFLVNLPLKIKLYRHLGANKTDFKEVEEKGWTSPIPLTVVCEPLAMLILEEVGREIRLEKRV